MVLVCPPGSDSEAEARRRGLAVRARSMRNDWDLRAVRGLRRILARERPDLVHLHTGRATWLGGLAARRQGVPALTTRRQDRRVRPGWRTRAVHGRLTELSVAISPAVARQLREGGVAAERVRVVPSAVDPAALAPRAGRDATREAQSAGEAPVVLALAALVPRKGLDVLLEALARLPAGTPRPALWIAGEGPERPALERRAAELGVDARFLGRREDVGDLLAACDVCVLPSRREGLGVAALEAMAAGRPLVATRVGGLAEAVADAETGLLVEPDDAAGLADALARLLADPELRARLGAAGPARVAERFAVERMVDAYEALYREVLEGARARGG